MTTKTARKQIEMVIYQYGNMFIQDVMIEGSDGVFRTQCTGKTFKEYIEDGKWDCVCIPFDEAIAEIHKLEDARLIKPFHEITEDEYMEMLECLPPQKWQTFDDVNIFQMSEYTTSNITGHYVSFNGKFYTANRRTSTPYAEIAKEIKAI